MCSVLLPSKMSRYLPKALDITNNAPTTTHSNTVFISADTKTCKISIIKNKTGLKLLSIQQLLWQPLLH